MLAIIYPLCKKGFVLTLDMVFTPHMYPGSELNIFNLHEYFLHFATYIIPGEPLQKILLSSILFFSGYFAFKLVKKITTNNTSGIIAGTFYMINPFVYERLLAGQWLFLVGYAFTPLFVLLIIKQTKENNPNFRDILSYLALWVVIGLLSKHHALLWWVIYTVFLTSKFFRQTTNNLITSSPSQLLRYEIIITTATFTTIVLFSSLLTFNSDELLYFSTSTGSDGLFLNLLTFNGFWAEGTIFDHIFDVAPVSKYLMLGLIFGNFAATPFTLVKNRKTKLIYSLIIIGFIGFILSFGSNGIIGKVYSILIDEFPLFRGMREPQKFLSLYILAFSILLGINSEYLFSKIKNSWRKYLLLIGITLIIVTSSIGIFRACNNQLETTVYPDSFNAVQDKMGEKVLVLPWNLYINVPWSESRIQNPSKLYFDKNIIMTEDYKKRNCDISYDGEIEDYLCINYEDSSRTFHFAMKSASIDNILIFETNSRNDFSELLSSEFLTEVYSDDNLSLYKVN